MSRLKIWHIVLSIVVGASLSGCLDEPGFSTDPNHRLVFSTDTVAFDTLFTDVSSATQSFLIYNRNKADLRIGHAVLAGGEDSPYRVNVDGLPGTAFSDLTIRTGDSMYVFVEVTVDPRGQDEPFEVKDSMLFTLESGMMQQIIFTAGGQDATVLHGVTIHSDTRFTGSRPYLVYDSLCVAVGSTLYLEPGTRMFFADGVEMQVYGRVEARGTVDSLVLFRGARTDRILPYLPYDRLSAQWGGITLHEKSHGNVFEHCDIHSGTYGLRANGSGLEESESKLVMRSSQIHNVDEDALQLTRCRATFTNCLFTNAGGHCVNILGGKQDFIHCTIANFFPWKTERGVAVNISNHVNEEMYPLLGANFVNSIITGSKNDELATNMVTETDTTDWSEYAQYRFTHSVINSWKEALAPDTVHFDHTVWEHKDSTAYGSTNFRTIDHSNFIYDFHLDSLSVARGVAADGYIDILPHDKDGQSRTTMSIDAGCYQYVEYVEEKE